jgi:hypothetical protein
MYGISNRSKSIMTIFSLHEFITEVIMNFDWWNLQQSNQ